MHKEIKVEYFAALRQQAGKREEIIQTNAGTVRELFEELRKLYSFSLTEKEIKIAINQKISSWDSHLSTGDILLLIPPVAGG